MFQWLSPRNRRRKPQGVFSSLSRGWKVCGFSEEKWFDNLEVLEFEGQHLSCHFTAHCLWETKRNQES